MDQIQSRGLLPNMQSMEEVGQLVMKMSQAGQHGDIFKLFAQHVTQLVPGLTHIRYHCPYAPLALQFRQYACLLHSTSASQTASTATACSVLLLPDSNHSSASTSGTQPVVPSKGSISKSKLPTMPPATSRLEWQQYMGGAKASKADAGKKEPDLLTWPYADLQTGNEMPGRPFRVSC